MKKITSYSTLFALLLPAAAFGSQQPFFYRTGPYSYQETNRFERSWLSTINFSVMGGGTKKGYQAANAIGANGTTVNGTTISIPTTGSSSSHVSNINASSGASTNGNGVSTNVLNMFGWQNFQFLGANIASNPGTSIYDANLAVLDQLPLNGTFGYVQYSGKFDYIEGDIYLAQNLCHGFFLDMLIPIIRTGVTNVKFVDKSTYTGFPNANNPNWEFLLTPANLEATLAEYSLTASDYHHSGIGDIVIDAGWTYNKEDLSDHVDFLDVTIKVGVNIPSGFKQNTSQAFSVAAGYNKHVGAPIQFDAAIGFFEWLALGAHVGGTFFGSKTQLTRMQTSLKQNGYIKLGLGEAKSSIGNIFDAGAYIKADHIAKGFSLSFGYLYAHQGATTLTPVNTVLFPTAIVNADSMLQAWHSHQISVQADYDFAKEGRRYNPNIGIFYSQPVAGKNVFKTMTGGGYVGLNVAWDF